MSDSLLAHAKYLETLLETNKVSLGLQAVYFGDQLTIPKTPIACVEPGEKTRTLNGHPRRTAVSLTNYIIIYHHQITSAEVREETNLQLAETVEALVHANNQFGGIAIDSLVTVVEAGYTERRNTFFRSSRLAIESRQQVQLPST
jgi:hypothetical protein